MTLALKAKRRVAKGERRFLARALYLLGTIQLVWVYRKLPPYLHLQRYERGADVMPCQARVLMMLVLRWAHQSRFLIAGADLLTKHTLIYRSHITPESFVFAIADTLGVAIAGWVATRIYESASEHGLLTPFIYPLVLVFCAASYVLIALHPFRFYYDLPSLGFFAAGLYLIYFRKHPLLFAVLFVVATFNRETTLLLLFFYALAAVTRSGIVEWRRLIAPRTLAVVVPLGIFWAAWHIYVGHLYAHNHFATISAREINVALILWPPAWPQLLEAGCYSIIPILIFRRFVQDKTLCLWLWILPVWFGIMFWFAIVDEPRLYGELIPYLVCMSAMIMEEMIVRRMKKRDDLDLPVAVAMQPASVMTGDGVQPYTVEHRRII